MTVVHRLLQCQRPSRIGVRRGGRRVLDELYSLWAGCIELHEHACVHCAVGFTQTFALALWCSFGRGALGALIGL